MRLQNLAPTPENYEIWYVYYAGSNQDVVRALDILHKNHPNPTQQQFSDIYIRFLSNSREHDTVREAGDRIQETIKTVTGAVSSVKNATQQYATTLTEVKTELNDPGDITKDKLESMLNNVMANTEDVLAQNRRLEEELFRSASVMSGLRRDLENVRKEAFTDSLTGLGNRKNFDTEIERILTEAAETKTTFCLLMMDIDHFKTFNDNYGHQIGDQVLRLVAKSLVHGVKGRDVACRYGGEEFAIILPETNLVGGVKVGDMLRYAIGQKDVVNVATGERLARITISGGVAEYRPGESVEELTARADSALYTAKHNGRNQIAAAGTPGQKRT